MPPLPDNSRLDVVECSADRLVVRIPAGGRAVWAFAPFFVFWFGILVPFTIVGLILGFGQGIRTGLALLAFLSIFYFAGGVIFRHWLRLARSDTLLLVENSQIAYQPVGKPQQTLRSLSPTGDHFASLCGHAEMFGREMYAVAIVGDGEVFRFGENLALDDQQWLVKQINERIGKCFRDECPHCNAALKVSHINPETGQAECHACSWTGAPMWSTADERALPKSDDWRQLIENPPTNIEVVLATPEQLRLVIHPDRRKSLGCLALLCLIVGVPALLIASSALAKLGIADALSMVAVAVGVGVLLVLTAWREVWSTEVVSFDRRTSRFGLEATLRMPRDKRLSTNARVIQPNALSQNRLQEAPVASAETTDNDSASVDIRDGLDRVEFACNQGTTARRWLRRVLSHYFSHGLGTAVESDRAVEGPSLARLPDACPRCGEPLWPSQIDVANRTIGCPRGLSCGWGTVPKTVLEQLDEAMPAAYKQIGRWIEDRLR